MGRLTWSTGLDMLSPCRGCRPPPPPGPSPSARRKSMLAVLGDPFGPPALAVPDFAPRRRSRPGEGGRGTSPAPRHALGCPDLSGQALGENPLRSTITSRRCPHPTVAVCPLLSFCPSSLVTFACELPAGSRCPSELSPASAFSLLNAQQRGKLRRGGFTKLSRVRHRVLPSAKGGSRRQECLGSSR